MNNHSTGTTTLSGVTFSDNSASNDGGGLFNNDTLTLTNCTVSGNTATNNGGGVFNNSSATTTLTYSDVQNNKATNDRGGGLYSKGGTLALSDATVSGNTAKGNGGGLYTLGGTTTLYGVTFSKNSAANGGGLNDHSSGTTTLSACTFSSNSAANGGSLFNYDSLTLINCTVSGNTASSRGGALFTNSAGSTYLTNCTVSGNTASSRGGALFNTHSLTLTNCTVTGNTAGSNGGGLYNAAYASYSAYFGTYTLLNGQANLVNTIVSGNGPNDIYNNSATAQHTTEKSVVSGTNNMIGTTLGGGSFSGRHNTVAGNPLLVPLGYFGGPTQTMPLLPGSLAIGNGINEAGVPSIDQRGQPRSDGVDIGAFQSQGFTIVSVSGNNQNTTVSTAFPAPLVVSVIANVSIEPVAGGIMTYTGPGNGASITPNVSRATIGATGQAILTATANGTAGSNYTVIASAFGVAGAVGFTLTNNPPPSLTVTTTDDVADNTDGRISLRAAIADALRLGGPQTITFDPTVFGTTPRTITLTRPLELTDLAGLTITGPGANLLTLSGGGTSQVIDLQGGSLTLSGLTIRGGHADRGGGLFNDGGTLTLTDDTITGNTALLGGGVYTTHDGVTTLTDDTITGNTALLGGGVVNLGGRTTLTHVPVSGNTALLGGGVVNLGGRTTLTHATITGSNRARFDRRLVNLGGKMTLFHTIAGRMRDGAIRSIGGRFSGIRNLIGDVTGQPPLPRRGPSLQPPSRLPRPSSSTAGLASGPRPPRPRSLLHRDVTTPAAGAGSARFALAQTTSPIGPRFDPKPGPLQGPPDPDQDPGAQPDAPRRHRPDPLRSVPRGTFVKA
jgi:predicted outer membrane repeat protein